jgi:integrase
MWAGPEMTMKLNATKVLSLVEKGERGRWGDGAGLWLQVDGKRASWLFRFTLAGKQRAMGLGAHDDLSLRAAREAAALARAHLQAGRDPIQAREEERRRAAEEAAAAATAATAATTFRQAADAWIAAHEKGWRNDKHRAQIGSTLSAYAHPKIGEKPVADISTSDVIEVLTPIWSSKPETGSRVRQRIEAVLAFALAQGWRTMPNVATWKGHVEALLPSPRKVRRVRHHPSLDWHRMPEFVKRLRAMPGAAAKALEFAILCASRSGEVRGMEWREVDLEAAIWIVPAARIKAGREHRVPLSDTAVALLRAQHAAQVEEAEGDQPDPGAFVWPGARKGAPMSDMTLAAVIDRMNETDTAKGSRVVAWADPHGEPVVPHGFRASFRDWAADNGHAADIAEAALAHAKGDQTARAYQRSDLFERRRHLMAAWDACVQDTRKRLVVVGSAA